MDKQKKFGSVVANSGIDLEINRGEIFSLLGAICGIVGFTSITVAWLNAAY